MVPTIHQCLCEIVFVKRVNNIIFVEIRIVCGSHSEAETQVGFIIFFSFYKGLYGTHHSPVSL